MGSLQFSVTLSCSSSSCCYCCGCCSSNRCSCCCSCRLRCPGSSLTEIFSSTCLSVSAPLHQDALRPGFTTRSAKVCDISVQWEIVVKKLCQIFCSVWIVGWIAYLYLANSSGNNFFFHSGMGSERLPAKALHCYINGKETKENKWRNGWTM